MFETPRPRRSAGVTVVTPNQRLSRGAILEFDAFQIGKALSVWEAPDILPFGAFRCSGSTRRLCGPLGRAADASRAGAGGEVWKQVVGGSGLLAVEGAAAKCRTPEPRQPVAHPPGAGNQDTEAFAQWLTHYKKKTENDLDTPRLPECTAAISAGAEAAETRCRLRVRHPAPQTKEFLDALGTEIDFLQPDARSRHRFASGFRFREARDRGRRAVGEGAPEAGATRIGVVIPSLREKRKRWFAFFSRVMRPGGEKTAMPFNVSLGTPLQEFPIVNPR